MTLLERSKRAYASTVQTVGMQIGVFISFTLLLALNSADFSNSFRSTPSAEGFLSVSLFMQLSGWAYLLFTLYLAVAFKEPRCVEEDDSLEIRRVYKRIFAVVQLPSVKRLGPACFFFGLSLALSL